MFGVVEDVLNVAGHRIAKADVESALVSHPARGETGVCGVPDDLKGEAIVAYVVLRAGYEQSDALSAELVTHVQRELDPIAIPAAIRFAAKLTKTRSGKIIAPPSQGPGDGSGAGRRDDARRVAPKDEPTQPNAAD